ncbi:MAG: hypothetical protein N3F09_05315 [Bacteroidia bacterium]|nr:hypothetical protein [Bacteroidia bacterium]
MRLIILTLLVFVGFSCTRDNQQNESYANNQPDSCLVIEKRAKKWDSIISNTLEYNSLHSKEAQTTFLNLAYYCTANKKSPEYLIKAVQLSIQDKNYMQARIALEFAENNFMKSEDFPMILFMLGELYGDPEQLNDPDKSKEYFNRLEKEFPNSTWARMVPDARKWIGKPKSEMFK